MKRIGAVILGLAMLMPLSGAAWAEPDAEQRAGSDAEQRTRSDARPEAEASRPEPSAPQPSGTRLVGEVPLYVPPNRGSPPMRVGGGSRGGQLPGRRI